jgi:hypothetical protein
MKIIAKTPTHLHLQANLVKRLLPDLGWCLCSGALAWTCFLVPDQMALQCQRVKMAVDCQVISRNTLSFHSETKSIQLQGAQVNHYGRQGTRLIIKTTKGEIIFLDSFGDISSSRLAAKQKIDNFLETPEQSQLNVETSNYGTTYLFCIFYLIMHGVYLFLVLKSPVWIKWEFVCDPNLSDHSERSGKLYGRFRGFFWTQEFCHSFGDVMALNTDVMTGKRRNPWISYHLHFRLQSIGEVALSPQGLKEAEWREVVNAISEMLQIPPSKVFQRNWWKRFPVEVERSQD